MRIEQLQKCILGNRYEISFHAQEERCEEKITLYDIEQAFAHGEIIEDYPQDKIDLLIALHACDTATDDAIFKGIKAGAKLIKRFLQ